MQLLRSLLLHARRLTTQQKGVGFANFLAVLTSAVASFISLTLKLRNGLQSQIPTDGLPSVAPTAGLTAR